MNREDRFWKNSQDIPELPHEAEFSRHLYDGQSIQMIQGCDKRSFKLFEQRIIDMDFNVEFTCRLKLGEINIEFSGVAEKITDEKYCIKELKIKEDKS